MGILPPLLEYTLLQESDSGDPDTFLAHIKEMWANFFKKVLYFLHRW